MWVEKHIYLKVLVCFIFHKQSLNYASKKNLKVIYSTGQILVFKYKNTTQSQEENLREP